MNEDNQYPNISIFESDWNGIAVKYCYMAATGDFALSMPQDGVSIAFLPHDRAIKKQSSFRQKIAIKQKTAIKYSNSKIDKLFAIYQKMLVLNLG